MVGGLTFQIDDAYSIPGEPRVIDLRPGWDVSWRRSIDLDAGIAEDTAPAIRLPYVAAMEAEELRIILARGGN